MKPRILFINSVCGFGSTGRIVADLSKSDKYDSLVCFGRKKDYANVNSYRFANLFDNAFGALRTILFDNNLTVCATATKRLINKIKEYNPDIIHLHNVHGYYVNVEMLFDFLKTYNKPVVWTMHDCWALTGYCPHFDFIQCDKYSTKCQNCPHGFSYPFSIFRQNVENDFERKKKLFNSINNLAIITPSKWLASVVKKSFLKEKDIQVINNGINLDNFYNSKKKNNEFTIIFVSSIWTEQKGFEEIKKIVKLLDENIKVIIVGKTNEVIDRCQMVERTDSIDELRDLYSSAHLLVNPTLQETFPTVNIESLACGTPIITYNTGGSSEIINERTGIVVKKYDYKKMAEEINRLNKEYTFDIKDSLERSKNFTKMKMLKEYEELYESLLVK